MVEETDPLRDDDILDVLVRARLGFIHCGLKPPSVILLQSNKEGMHLLSVVEKRSFSSFPAGKYGRPIEHPDGTVWMEIEVMSMKLRWPAEKHPTSNHGDYVWQ